MKNGGIEMNPTELTNALAQFTGTEQWYRHALNSNITYTDGVKFFADIVGAHWLLDIIATQPEILSTMHNGLAVIELRVDKDSSAVLTCEDGDYRNTYTRLLEFTDCPVGVWKFFFTDNVILLPGEY